VAQRTGGSGSSPLGGLPLLGHQLVPPPRASLLASPVTFSDNSPFVSGGPGNSRGDYCCSGCDGQPLAVGPRGARLTPVGYLGNAGVGG